MHKANLQPLEDFLSKKLSENFEIKVFTDRKNAKLNTFEGVSDTIYLRPNGKVKARRKDVNSYVVTYPLSISFELIQVENEPYEIIEHLKTLMRNVGIDFSGWDCFNEDVYTRETGKPLKNCEARLGYLEFEWFCIEQKSQTDIEIKCK